MVHHTIRYDDLSAVSDTTAERGLIELLLRYRVPCTFAAVPFTCDPQSLLNAGEVRLLPFPTEKVKLLQPLLFENLAEIALHGYAHLMLSQRRGQREFCDQMSIETQRALIRKGRAHLENVFETPVRLFVPPWENLDRSTMSVLKEEGLAVPTGTSVSIQQTRGVLLTARRLTLGRSSVATIMHDYDLCDMADFERILRSWVEITGIERHVVGDQLYDASREEGNTSFRAALNSSRIGRRVMRDTQLIDWDCDTAKWLSRWAVCLP